MTNVDTRTEARAWRTSISSFMSVIAATAAGEAPRTRYDVYQLIVADPHDNRAFRADRVHVVHALLQRRDPEHAVRQSRPALVEQDQPPHARQPAIEGRQRGPLPAGLERADEAVDEDDVQR